MRRQGWPARGCALLQPGPAGELGAGRPGPVCASEDARAAAPRQLSGQLTSQAVFTVVMKNWEPLVSAPVGVGGGE